MSDKPILMSAPMVRAILEGRKTQTRRIVKFPDWFLEEYGKFGLDEIRREITPKYSIGDHLWVRETWMIGDSTQPYFYRATQPKYGKFHKWKPSIFMPRSASRINLEVIISARAERLQNIGEQDAIAEGCHANYSGVYYYGGIHPTLGTRKVFTSPRDAYKNLWESINGKDSWAKNPWVWVITFEVTK